MVTKTVSGNANIDIGEATIYINGVVYDSNQYYLRFKERMNQVPLIEGNFFDIANNNPDLVEKNTCYIKANGVVVSPLFIINKSKPMSDTFRNINGVGFVENKLSNFTVENTASEDSDSQSGRPQYSGVAINTIVSEQMSENVTGVTAGTISTNVVNIRSENDTYLSFFAGLADVGGVDWYTSYSSDLATKYINLTTRGNDKSGSITLAMSGAGQNCEKTERKKDFESLKNVIKLFGYGDGVNQKESYAEHSTSVRSVLSNAINETDNSITLVDASDFGSSGDVWIGCEKCSYTGKSSNTLTGLTRGVAFRGNVDKAYSHAVNSPVTDAQYTSSSPQSSGDGSSINTHGIIQKAFNSRNVIDQSTLDILAEKLLIERKGSGTDYSAPERVVVRVNDYNWGLENIGVGDQVTITDVDTGLSGSYRCYGREFIYDLESANVGLDLEFSNTTFSVLNEIAKEQQESVSLQKYMQGSTNIFSINETDNCESGTDDYLGLTMFFNIPEDAVAINSVKLSYRNESPKTWSSNTSSGGGSTSGSGGGSTVTSGSGGGTTATSGSNSESTMQSGSSSFLSSISTNTTSWQDVTTLTATMSAYSIVSCACSIQLASTNSEYDSNPMNSDYIAYRLYDGSSYYPNSNGVRIPLNFGWSHHHYDSGSSGGYVHGTPLTTGTSFFANGAGAIIYPKNTSGKTVKLQVALNRSISSSYAYINYAYQVLSNHTHDVTLSNHTHSVTVANHTHSTPNHSHSVTYDLAQQSYTTSDIRIWTTDDASGSPSWTERTSTLETILSRSLKSANNQSENDLNLTSFFNGTGWKGIKITTNGNSRIKAQVITKCFIQSRVV